MGICNPYTDEEKTFIEKEYYNIGALGVAKQLTNHSRDSIKAYAHRNGLKVSKEYRTEFAVRANKSWIRTDEIRKRIGDGHRKYSVFRCAICNKKIAHYRTHCWDCYANNCAGSGNNNWKGGVTTLSMLSRIALWKVWSLPIFERDNFTCQLCGDNTGGNLEAHHIRRFKKIRNIVVDRNKYINIRKFEGRKIMSELIAKEHTLQDGITLCKTCHIASH